MGSLAKKSEAANPRPASASWFLEQQVRFSANFLPPSRQLRHRITGPFIEMPEERLTPITTTWYLQHRRIGTLPTPATRRFGWLSRC